MKSAAHQYEDKLLEFAYGELPRHEADAVDAHVRGCAKCAEAVEEIRGVRATMAQLPLEAAPDAGLESLLAYAEQTAKRNAEAQKPAPSFFRRFLMPLASLAALFTVGVVSLRANEEFDTSPAAASAEKKVEEYEGAAEKKKAKADVAPPPAPVAAAQPEGNVERAEPTEDLQGGLAQALADDRKEWGGKRGYVQEQPEAKKAVPQSSTRRAQKTKSVQPAAPLADLGDFSNASGRGAREREEKPAEPKQEASDVLSAKGGGALFGLGDGSASGLGGVSTSGPGTLGTGSSSGPAPVAKKPAPKVAVESDKASKKLAKDDAADDAPARQPPAETAAAPAPTAPPPAPPPSVATMNRGSYGLRPMSSSSAPSSADEDQALLERVDAVGLDNQAKFEERQKQQSAQVQRTRSLEAARDAAGRGDTSGAIRFALETLKNGATGSQRAEALKRLCDGYEALGQPANADTFCDRLLTEFPTSSYAQAVTERRGAVQRAVPAKAAPADRKASEAAPASSY